MLVEDATVVDIATRPEGLCDSLPQGAIHLAMGTYGVGAIRTLAAAHHDAGQILVAAPVLGRPDLAASGQLGIVAAGPETALRACAPLLQLMGRKTFEAGTLPESATAIKLANNMLLGCAMVAMGEGFSLVRGFDVPAATFYDVLAQGLFSNSPAYTGYGKTMVDESWIGRDRPSPSASRTPISSSPPRTSRACRCRASTCASPAWRRHSDGRRIRPSTPVNRPALQAR